ncbi:MAG: glycosyltransferase [Flavobacterium sp.]|nr:MAG: glycosyltransferase [Flavobacterium sp.]
MKVSLITVTYNSAKYLQNAIQSVSFQDYPNIEYIVVDGGSSDETLSIINQNSSCISKWISEKDNGMYDAINKGMKMATGDIIGILNSDDMLASNNVISKIVTCFKEQQVDSLFGDLLYVDAEETSKIHRFWKGLPYKRSLFNTGWMPAHPTFYVRKEVVDQLGGYQQNYFSASDFEFMTRYLYKHRISSHYLPELIVKMRKGGMSNGNLQKRIRANRRDYLAMKVNNVPFPFIVSLIKPLRKIPQYLGFIHQGKEFEQEQVSTLSAVTA